MNPVPTSRAVAAAVAATLLLAACAEREAAVGHEPAAVSAPAQPATAATSEPAPPQAAAASRVGSIEEAVAGTWRDPAFRERDGYRNPARTLEFFGVEPGHTVLEITPGGGWYMEILAPLVRGQGQYLGAVSDPARASSEGGRDYATRTNAALREKLEAAPEVYGDARLVEFDPANPEFGEAGSVDVVLTFRNVHNWRSQGHAEAMFAGFHQVLAPGGVLGVVEHRAAGPVAEDDRSGYVGEDQVIAMAEAAGFVLEEKSEINANPADTRDHPNGVWTLPPVGRHDEADAEKYREIGESDRMTLRFRKPAGGH